LKQIVVATQQEADGIIGALNSGINFDTLMVKYPGLPDGRTAGYLWIPMGDLGDLCPIIKNLKIGEYSEPVKRQPIVGLTEAFYIIFLEAIDFSCCKGYMIEFSNCEKLTLKADTSALNKPEENENILIYHINPAINSVTGDKVIFWRSWINASIGSSCKKTSLANAIVELDNNISSLDAGSPWFMTLVECFGYKGEGPHEYVAAIKRVENGVSNYENVRDLFNFFGHNSGNDINQTLLVLFDLVPDYPTEMECLLRGFFGMKNTE
jgi:hypothetical protein